MSLSSFHGGHSPGADGKEVREIAEAAARQNFVAFGFTEHFQMPPMALAPEMALYGQLEFFGDYVADVLSAQQEHPFVLLGAEIEYIRGGLEWTREQVARFPFDYLVGSVHYVRLGDRDLIIDSERRQLEVALELAGGSERLQLKYYEHVLELISWNLSAVIGHLDLIKMLLTPMEAAPTPAIENLVRTVLGAMKDFGVAMDVNARGLIKPCRRIYPEDWILTEARRIGVPVTLGDDSHSAADVGRNLSVAVEAIARAGYEHVWMVRPGRELERAPLPSYLAG
jgi:histidinol-phosphatase (PHP family)